MAIAYYALYRQAKPSISIYYEPNPDVGSIIDLVIKNTGGSAATNLTFSVPIPIKRFGIEKADSSRNDCFDYTIHYLAAGRELRYWGGQFAGLKAAIPEGLEVVSQYGFKSPLRKRKGKDVSILDIRYLKGVNSSNSAATDLSDALKGKNNTIFSEIHESLNSVAKELKTLNITVVNLKELDSPDNKSGSN
ncbi:hypothetical protein OFY17_02715 [Marinomonas sp. C2222]|uniref:Uncharacterized protein n=1 Tax=Marinomonas sargassi TaxID=2984494 RepID=A0ABT2YPH3_9GAMM|nr:hypothetical protein [Marinomonas sargassi]MCV2401788.1 hypothetical protein [Marinomonas sargassi]